MNRLIQILSEEFKFEEENTTSNIEPVNTPYAFGKKVKKPNDDAYTEEVPDTDRFFKRIEAKINEIAYSDFKSDSTQTNRQKINNHLMEINRKLREVEQMINHAHKLKTEDGHDANVFWKKTRGSFVKIKERLNRLTSKIVEITG